MNSSELDYDLPPELIAQQPAERRDESRLLVYSRATGESLATCVFRDLPELLPHGTLAVVNDTRVVPGADPDRAAARRGAAARAARRRGVGGARAADAAAARRAAATGRSSCSSTSARAAGGCGCTGEPAGEAPLPPYITEPLADPERYQTVYARERGLGGGADGRAALHAGAARAARRRARDAARRARHVPAARRSRRVEEHRDPRRALRGRRGRVGADPAADRVLAVGTTTVRVLETLARGAPARRPHGAVRHAGLRVPPRRPPADELPPAALDAARARDGLRRRRGDPPPLPPRGRRSATASTPSAMRC